MEHDPFIDDAPIKSDDFPMAMLNNQRPKGITICDQQWAKFGFTLW